MRKNITLYICCLYCTKNQKVSGSIPDGVMEFFIDIILPIALWLWGRLSFLYLLFSQILSLSSKLSHHYPVAEQVNLCSVLGGHNQVPRSYVGGRFVFGPKKSDLCLLCKISKEI
jgi:hypothetical protein